MRSWAVRGLVLLLVVLALPAALAQAVPGPLPLSPCSASTWPPIRASSWVSMTVAGHRSSPSVMANRLAWVRIICRFLPVSWA